ncbi:hypothetical protein CASFOL_002895 [Castilleja foliolosa]|uniref:Uncharacterized protein n=1 Tax=Castilleja foliolosa TaxID=1961234 RepID=A0ABD3EJ04_9LAMI
MDKLSNPFSLLELDSEDSKGESSKDGTSLNNENGNQQKNPSELRMPLVWIDLEMTGFRSC